MNGVEILSITEHAIMESAWSWPMFFGLFISVFGIILVIGVLVGFSIHDSEAGIMAGAIVGLIIALLLSLFLTVVLGEKEVGKEYHYKVIIDDSVSMNEFLNKYEILDQEGKIYTVKEK